MKKILSLIVLGSLAMSTGMQAKQGFWNGRTAVLAGIGATFGSFALYAHYDIQKNKQKTKNASYNKNILKQLLKKATHCELIGEPGISRQIELLHIDDKERESLLTAIETYDSELRKDTSAVRLNQATANLKAIINPLLDNAHKITRHENQGTLLRFASGVYAATAFSMLAAKYLRFM